MPIRSRSPIEAVLFDLDDTLHNRTATFAAWARWFAIERLGVAADHADHAALLAELTDLDAGGYGPKDALFATLAPRYPVLATSIDDLVTAFHTDLLTHMPPLPPETTAMLGALAERGIRWGLVTNGGARQQSRKVANLGLADGAACIVISEAEGMRKPEPRIFHLAAERLGVAPERTLFVGDHPDNDIVGAATAGMRTAWIRKERAWPAALATTPPDHTIDHAAEVLALLER